MKYSIVIPTFNHCDDLLVPCIESIFKYTDMTEVELIISANGCTDNTSEYLSALQKQFENIGFSNHIKVIWNNEPIGFAAATNAGILASVGEKVILLNNDTVLLHQSKNLWIKLLNNPFIFQSNCGISCPIKQHSVEAGHDFAVFFCAMIDRKVFNKIGLLNTEYGIGSGEDVEFCIEAEHAGFLVSECTEKHHLTQHMYTGSFPIYHKGEATVLDTELVKNYHGIFKENGLKLAKKYNIEYYRNSLNNNYERHLSIKGEQVPAREAARYKWASSRMLGNTVFEVGCSNGYGSQFFDDEVQYIGVDYDQKIVDIANSEGWGNNKTFLCCDVNTIEWDVSFDTIVAMEVIEHLDNGLEIVEMLKKHCKRLLITVPYMESPGFWGEHHKLHMLNESHLPGFKYTFCDEYGNLSDKPIENSKFNLMLCEYNA